MKIANRWHHHALLGAVILLVVQCSSSVESSEGDSEYPLLETMGYYQRFSQKLWLAGKNENWELAEFYAHELQEVTEELIGSDVMHDGKNLSDLAEQIFEMNVKKVDGAINKRDGILFRENYELMIGSCNVCHTTTNHPFLKIIIPDNSSPFNQQF